MQTLGFLHLPSHITAEAYSEPRVSLRIQSECRKIRTRKNSVLGHFSRSTLNKILLKNFVNFHRRRPPPMFLFKTDTLGFSVNFVRVFRVFLTNRLWNRNLSVKIFIIFHCQTDPLVLGLTGLPFNCVDLYDEM